MTTQASPRPPQVTPPSGPALSEAERPRLLGRLATTTERNRADSWRPRWLWAALAVPGGIWLVLLIVVPFYVMLCVAFGALDPVFQSPIPIWNPAAWSAATVAQLWHEFVGRGAFLWPPVVRTIWYTAAASAISLVIAYPVAYFVSRYAGRRKPLFLLLLIAPFWVSYMMRMLAWIDLLQSGGYVNKVLEWLQVVSAQHPVAWLDGKAITVIIGLVYGYIPYLIIVLYAGLDRIDGRLLEASRDLGFSRLGTFWRVTLPLSRPTLAAGAFVTVLPMVGDFFTNQLLAGTPHTTMIGNVIEGELDVANLQPLGAILAVALLIALLLPMALYVRSTSRAAREGAL